MERTALLIAAGGSLVAFVSAHGNLSKPTIRSLPNGGWDGNPILWSDGTTAAADTYQKEHFICRHRDPIADADQITVTAGTDITFETVSQHDSDCGLHMTYDIDKADTEKRWFLVGQVFNCNQVQKAIYTLPGYLPAGKAILRSTWMGLHSTGRMEHYADCIDVKVKGPSNGELPMPMYYPSVSIPGNRDRYREWIYKKYFYIVNPPQATVRGQCAPSPPVYKKTGDEGTAPTLTYWKDMNLIWSADKSTFSGLQNVDSSLVSGTFDFNSIDLTKCADHNPKTTDTAKVDPAYNVLLSEYTSGTYTSYNAMDMYSSDFSCRPFCCVDVAGSGACAKATGTVEYPPGNTGSTSAPTTSAPTTSAPTTSAPTTSSPTTNAPTTTAIPTTSTTISPTTSTSAPTTSAPGGIVTGGAQGIPSASFPLMLFVVACAFAYAL